VIDAPAVANQLAREWFIEQIWRAERRVEREAEARAEAARRRAQRPISASAEELHEALLEIPCDVWVPALTDIELPRHRTVCCPFHDDRTPSCRFYETRFHCFGCQASGDIFNFASRLWGVETHSPKFPTLRERLADHLLGVPA